MNIALLLQMAAETCPERLALTCEGQHMTYQDLLSAGKKAAVRFAESECRYISVLDESSPAVAVALIGAAIAGIPYVPLNYRLSAAQLREQRQRIEPAFLIVSDEMLGNYLLEPKGWVVARSQFMASLAQAPEADPVFSDDPVAVAVQLFTSGTTGTPKAAILRHEHLISYILGSVEFMAAAEKEANLLAVPPYHVAGISAVMSSIYACRRFVQLPAFQPETWLERVAAEGITSAFVVPTMLSRIIDFIESSGMDTAGLGSLEAIAYGGGRMPVTVIRRALELLPQVNFTNAYGLTETSSTITLLGPEEHRQALQQADPTAQARLGSVGKPLPSVEMEVRDPEGRRLEARQRGEIYVRGPQVSGEYLGQSPLEPDGWFATRDAGYLDEEGYLYLSGRADDVIVRGGENIAPGEIEDELIYHPSVRDVAVFGVPSEEWGEGVAIALVLQPGAVLSAEEVRQYIRERLRSSRVPDEVHFTRSLPYNEMGKLLRRLLREQYA